MNNTTVDKIKIWVFGPVTALLVWFITDTLQGIRKDLDMVKSDVKTLLTQSSTDKARIDNLEKDVRFIEQKLFNQTSNKNPNPVSAPKFTMIEAIRPDDQTSLFEKKPAYKESV